MEYRTWEDLTWWKEREPIGEALKTVVMKNMLIRYQEPYFSDIVIALIRDPAGT